MTPEQHTLERYLSAATRGLWGRRRREVREELECHLLERARRLEVLGIGRAQALERACAGMGSAGWVAWGFMEVHSMSKFLLASVFLAAGGGSLFLASAQDPIIFWGSNVPCTLVEHSSDSPTNRYTHKARFCPADVPGLSFGALTRQFEAAGFRVKPVMYERLPGRPIENLEITSPRGQVSRVPFTLSLQKEEVGREVDPGLLLSELATTLGGSAFTLEGWSQPRLSFLGKSVLLESPRAEAIAYNLYAIRAFSLSAPELENTAHKAAEVELARPHYPEVLEGLIAHRFRVSVPDETVLAIFAYGGAGKVVLDIAPVQAGTLEVYVPAGPLEVRSRPDFIGATKPSVYVVPVQTRYDPPQKGYNPPQALEVKSLD